MPTKIKIIDLFAGPGGLGEGFSAFKDENEDQPFSIAVSVEKEASAHRTLQLRAFFRKFPEDEKPDEYYQYVRGNISREQLFSAYPEQARIAKEETLEIPRALGIDNKYIEDEIERQLDGHDGPTIVIGGPPCQAYSLVGRARNMGTSGYIASEDKRHFLYKEYLNILSSVQPEVFVMENVKGILSASIDGEKIFPQIIRDLKSPGKALGKKNKEHTYKLYSFVKSAENPHDPEYLDSSDFIIRAEEFGIPQARHRVILLGVRDDINMTPQVLEPAPHLNIEKVIGDLPVLRSGLSKHKDSEKAWKAVVSEIVKNFPRKLRMHGYRKFAEKVKYYPYTKIVADDRGGRAIFVNWSVVKSMPRELKRWYRDDQLKVVLNHETRGHIVKDLERYYFCASFAWANPERANPNPKAHEFPKFLAPNHKNWNSGKFIDRFRVQAKGKYATTITSHISKDGHYFIHYDPLQCRSLTVREAARIQTFPDNYFFEGNRTQQYVQVGNAVPPFLSLKIAKIISKLLDYSG